MSKESFVNVRVSVDWRLNALSDYETFSFVWNLSNDYTIISAIQRHIGSLYELLRRLGVCESSVEIANARVERA